MNADVRPQNMLRLLILFFCLSQFAFPQTLVIDNFSFDQGPVINSGTSPSQNEISDPSIFGNYRRSLVGGYLPVIFDGTDILPGDSSGTSTLHATGGLLILSKTAHTGSSFVSYSGRAFTPGDNIGDLSLDISGGPSSLSSPIISLRYNTLSSHQTLSLTLTSDVDTASYFDLLLQAGTTLYEADLTMLPATGIGSLGPADFANIEGILIGLANGDPTGSVELDSFAFIPEPSSISLLMIGLFYIANKLRSNRVALTDR